VVVVVMVRVPSAAPAPNESRPNQQQQRNQPYRAEDYKTFTEGRVA
jgi:hypothetical protein